MKKSETRKKDILSLIKENPGISSVQIAQILKLSRIAIYNYLVGLIKEDNIEVKGNRKSTRYFIKRIYDFPYEKNEYGGWNFDRYRIPILHSFWLSTDTNYKTIRKKGDSFIEVDEPYRTTTRPPKLRNNENQKTDKHDKITVYQCSWVIDTDFVFDYGKMYNQSYDFKNKTPKLPCHLFKIEGKSKLESMIPVLDLIEMTYLKLQNDCVFNFFLFLMSKAKNKHYY